MLKDDLGRTFQIGDEVILTVPADTHLGTKKLGPLTVKSASWFRPVLHHILNRGLVVDGGWFVELIGPKGGYMYWKQGEDGGQIEHT
jgi:hypothetical protein